MAAKVARLKSNSDQIAWIDLSGTDLTDTALTVLSKFPHITSFQLQNTDIGDYTLAHIRHFVHLEYLCHIVRTHGFKKLPRQKKSETPFFSNI